MLRALVLLALCPWLPMGAPVSLPVRRVAHPPVPPSVRRDVRLAGGTLYRQAPWYGETVLQRMPALSYITIYAGTPPQAFKVQVDTGSSDLVLPGVRCRSCDDIRGYNPNASSTSEVLHCPGRGSVAPHPFCRFAIGYGDGTKLEGVLVRDRLAFDFAGRPALTTAVYLDIITRARPPGVFTSMGIDGLFGMAFDSITSHHLQGALTAVMQEQGLYDVFGLYVGSDVWSDDGVLTLGGVDMRRFKGPLQVTPITQQSYYCVEVTGLEMDGRPVLDHAAAFGTVFVDSGTTLTLLPRPAFAALRAALQRHYCHLPLVCPDPGTPNATLFNEYCLVQSALPHGYPTFTWRFGGGAVVAVPPAAYFRRIPVDEAGLSMFCFGIAPITTEPSYTILGDTFMAAAYVVFDRQRMRVGFGVPTKAPVAGGGPAWPEGRQKPVVSDAMGWVILLLLAVPLLLCCYAEASVALPWAPTPRATPRPRSYGTL